MSFVTMSTIAALAIVIVGFILPLRLSWRSKAIMCVIALLAVSKSYIYHIVGGNTYDPEIPYNLSFVFDIARTTMLFLMLLVLVRFVLNCLYRIVKLSWSVSLLPTFSLFHAQLMLLVSFACACYGTSCAYGMPEIKPYEFTIERLDPRLDGMRLVVMSDIHVSSPTDVNLIYKMVHKVNALEPDLILLPGDLMDGSVEQRRPITNLLFELKAKYGTFISSGNHEYYSGYQEWRDYFEQGGFISLDNKVVELLDNQGKPLMNLGGITDPRAARFNLPMPDPQGVIKALDPQAPSIILSHRPQYATDFAASKQVDLVVSGHTHGGLVVGLDRLVANANGGFVSGLYQLGDTKLVVCNGTMLWMGMPLRLGVPSQILQITLRSAERPTKDTLMLTRAADKAREIAANAAQAKAQKAKVEAAEASKTEAQTTSEATETAADTESTVTNTAQTATSPETSSSTATETTATDSQEIPAHGLDLGELGPRPNQPNAVQGLQLILPMKNAENGTISESVTNVALLPNNLTADQLRRINDIINEDPVEIAKAKAAAEAAKAAAEAMQLQALSKQVNLIVRKDSTTLQEQATEQSSAQENTANTATNAQAQTTAANTSTPEATPPTDTAASATEAGVMQLVPKSSASTEPNATSPQGTGVAPVDATAQDAAQTEAEDKDAASEDSNEVSLEMMPRRPVVQIGDDDTDTTLELQAEYAISLGNSALEINDQSVQEVTPQKEIKED